MSDVFIYPALSTVSVTNKPPDHCPHCGQVLTAVDPPTVHHCEACDRPVFYNPTPSARVAVVDGDEILLCAIGIEELWETPGGRVEAAEDPPVTATRELREETGLRADPGDLELFHVGGFESVPGQYKTRLLYAVSRSDTDGTLSAGDEHVEVEFWSPAEMETASASLTDRQPPEQRDLSWWTTHARDALGQ